MVVTRAPRVYSYIRFSTPEQAMGDSERRQLAEARAWAKKMGYVFDESLVDYGLSGFHGTNRTKGALGRFLERVKNGDVPPGSILVVEAIDRLSRENVITAIETIVFGLINHGITIQTLGTSMNTYNRESIETHSIFGLIVAIQQAHESSRLKSERVSGARQTAREKAKMGRTLTRQVPYWVKCIEDGRRLAIPEAAETIRHIFELKLEGVGTDTLAVKLNREAIWMPPPRKRKCDKSQPIPGWRGSYIKKILTNRAVLGEYQPYRQTGGRNSKRTPCGDPIPDYFPRIVPPDLFHAVQQKLAVNKGKGGRTGKVLNLFRHLVKCAYCGASMRLEGKGKPPKGAYYLVCDRAKRGLGCACHRIRYDECEKLIIDNCHKLRPEQVLPNPKGQAQKCKSLRQRVHGLDAQRNEIQQQIENLTNQIAITKSQSGRDRYEVKATELETQQNALEAELAESRKDLSAAEQSVKSFAMWMQNCDTLLTSLGDVEVRLRLSGHLREIIERIDVFAVGHVAMFDIESNFRPARPSTAPAQSADVKRLVLARPRIERGDDIAEYIDEVIRDAAPELRRSKTFHAFLEHVVSRRMSKEGRFLRVYFKSGATVDIVPAGSLAGGSELIKKGTRKRGWRFVSPDINKLWQDFQCTL